VYGIVQSEAALKTWCILFYTKTKTETRKSAQLTFVDKSELPLEVHDWFLPTQPQPINENAITSPSPSPSDEKENSSCRTVTGSRNRPSQVQRKTPTFPSPLDDSFASPTHTPGLSSEHGSQCSDENSRESEYSGTVRRKSILGKSVQRKKQRNRAKPQEKRVLFPDLDDDSYSNPDLNNTIEEEDDVDEDDEDVVMTIERLILIDENIADDIKISDLDGENKERTTAYVRARNKAMRQKKNLIGRRVTVTNGPQAKPIYSTWEIIDDIIDSEAVTAKRRPEDEIGVIGLDFNKLAGADFPLVEVFLRFWPGNAIKQLKKLNDSMRKKYDTRFKAVTLKEFFTFIACLLAAAPAGFGGDKLWNPSSAIGIFPTPDLQHIIKKKRFSQIKSCFADAFNFDYHTDIAKEGVAWCPIPGKTAANDEWAPLQGLVNDFNDTVKRNFAASDQLCLDESMSPWRPRKTKKGNLPHLSYIERKPKPIGTEFKSVACSVTGIITHLEIQRGKVSVSSL
jgi:hypothetical protein